MRAVGVAMLIVQLLSLMVLWPFLLLAGPVMWVLWWVGLFLWLIMIAAGGSKPIVIINQQISTNREPPRAEHHPVGVRREPSFKLPHAPRSPDRHN
jgi:hypothetical protein